MLVFYNDHDFIMFYTGIVNLMILDTHDITYNILYWYCAL